MNKFILIIFLLLIGYASNSTQKQTCQDSGKIDFMYVNIPCDECVNLIESIFTDHPHIFSYDIIRNKETHIIINYCYNYKKTNSQDIEETLIDNNFSINQSMTEIQEKSLQSLCCKRP